MDGLKIVCWAFLFELFIGIKDVKKSSPFGLKISKLSVRIGIAVWRVYSLKNQLNRPGCNYSKFDFEKSSPVGHGARVAKSLRRGRKRCLRGCGGRANDTRRNFGGGRRLKVVKRRRHESRLNDISGRSDQAFFRYFFSFPYWFSEKCSSAKMKCGLSLPICQAVPHVLAVRSMSFKFFTRCVKKAWSTAVRAL